MFEKYRIKFEKGDHSKKDLYILETSSWSSLYLMWDLVAPDVTCKVNCYEEIRTGRYSSMENAVNGHDYITRIRLNKPLYISLPLKQKESN